MKEWEKETKMTNKHGKLAKKKIPANYLTMTKPVSRNP